LGEAVRVVIRADTGPSGFRTGSGNSRTRVGENGLWSMAYVITDPATVKMYSSTSQLDPVNVTVTFTGGDTAKYALQWGLDTCAQLNHGC